jgi:hypothetical protein
MNKAPQSKWLTGLCLACRIMFMVLGLARDKHGMSLLFLVGTQIAYETVFKVGTLIGTTF